MAPGDWQFIARGITQLVKPLPSKRWKKKDSPQAATPAFMNHLAPNTTINQPSAASQPPGQIPFQFTTALQAATVTPSKGAPVSQPTGNAPLANALFVFSATTSPKPSTATWTIRIGVYPTLREDVLRKQFSPLRGFVNFIASSPWNGHVTLQFSTEEHAANAVFMLKETYIKDGDKGEVTAQVSDPQKV